MKAILQAVAALAALLVTGAIHYHVHPLTEVNTVLGALAVAFSFWPGMILGYLVLALKRSRGENEPEVPAAAGICAMLWFVYLFRALTLLVHLPGLSNWTQAPVEWLVSVFERF